MKKIVLALLCLFISAVPALAKDTVNLDLLNQADFKSFSEDIGMAASYQPAAPAEPLGDKLPGIDAGVEASYVKFDTGSSWYKKMNAGLLASGSLDTVSKEIYIPRVHVQVGLPVIPIDLGVSYSQVPDTDYKLVGYELKWAILSGGMAAPAIALRGAYTKLSGVNQLDLSTTSADISISKGILIFIPYAGVGSVWITSTPHDPVNPTLQKENIRKTKGFVGTKIKIFPFINLDIEGDFANVNVYTARLNVNF
jgi:hypothetical protein